MKKDGGCSWYPPGVESKRLFYYILGCSVSKGSLTEGALAVAFRVLSPTKYNRRNVLFSNWCLGGGKLSSHAHKTVSW